MIKNFLMFSGCLFWLLVITVFLPFDMGFFGLIGLYMMMFGFPYLFFISIIFSLLLTFLMIIDYNNYREYLKEKKK